ncbi:MAG: CARDB domain-containing protein [Ferruginibacter sp.]
MKRIFSTNVLLLCMLAGNSQILKTPTNLPRKPQMPVHKIPALTKPDLQITSISLISDDINPTTKLHTVTVSINIKNTGQSTAPAFYIGALCQPVTIDQSTVRDFAAYHSHTAMNGGASLTEEYIFVQKPIAIKTASFKFWVQADVSNNVSESNEINNGSPEITINTHH